MAPTVPSKRKRGDVARANVTINAPAFKTLDDTGGGGYFLS
jgi:hypothetical protein